MKSEKRYQDTHWVDAVYGILVIMLLQSGSNLDRISSNFRGIVVWFAVRALYQEDAQLFSASNRRNLLWFAVRVLRDGVSLFLLIEYFN